MRSVGGITTIRRMGNGPQSFCGPTVEETTTAHYFHYYVREDDRLKPIPYFMSRKMDARKEPEHKQSKLSDREPPYWLSKLLYFEVDFLHAAADLLILTITPMALNILFA